MTDETISGADSGNQFGDYNSLSAHANKFFPSWTDRRNNAKEEIWTAPINATSTATYSIAGSAGTTGANVTAGSSSATRSEEHTCELQPQSNLVCRLLLEDKNDL